MTDVTPSAAANPGPDAATTTASSSSSSSSPSSSPTTPLALPSLSLPSLRRKEHPARTRAFVLVDPHGAFTATLQRPMLALCLVVAGLFSLLPPAAFLAAAARSGGVEVVVRDEMKKSGRLDKLPPEAREKAFTVIVPATKVFVPLTTLVKRELWILACAAVCLAVLRGTRPQVRFTDVVACAAVGAAPWFIHDVIAALSLGMHDLRTLDPQNAVLSNPAAWFLSGKDSRGPLAVFLRGVDVFELWGCAWMSTGIARAVGGRTSLPYVVVFGLHTGGVLLATAQAAAAQAAG